MQTIRQPTPHLAFHDFGLTRATDACRGGKIVDCWYCTCNKYPSSYGITSTDRSRYIHYIPNVLYPLKTFYLLHSSLRCSYTSTGVQLWSIQWIGHDFLEIDNCQCKVSRVAKCNTVQSSGQEGKIIALTERGSYRSTDGGEEEIKHCFHLQHKLHLKFAKEYRKNSQNVRNKVFQSDETKTLVILTLILYLIRYCPELSM